MSREFRLSSDCANVCLRVLPGTHMRHVSPRFRRPPLLLSLWLLAFAGLADSAVAQPGGAAPAAALGVGTLQTPSAAKRIVLIGGKKSHGPGMHDFPNGIPYLAALLPVLFETTIDGEVCGRRWPTDWLWRSARWRRSAIMSKTGSS